LRQDALDTLIEIKLVIVDTRYHAHKRLGHRFTPEP
jgi:hypothetical protein